ncbi:MAG: hypothetical protein AAF415_14095 [Pseudomonadota bacterium]
MPYSGSGNYAVTDAGGGRVDLSAGIDTDGSLLFIGGTYTIGAYLAVGANLYNTLPVRGELQITSDAQVGFAPVAGQAASVQVGTNLNSNYSGTVAYGYLDILGGGRLEVSYTAPAMGDGSNAYANFVVGATAGALGQITVDGVGSELVASGASSRIALGFNGGLGALVAVSGGKASTLSLQAGGNGGLGQVYITGTGSEVTVSSANGGYIDPAYAGQSGFATFGLTGGRGLLGVVNGGQMTVENVDGETDQPMARFGRDNGSYGYGLVRGAGSELLIAQHGLAGDDFASGATLSIGEGGQGVFLVEETGVISLTGDAARLNIAAGRYSAGQPDVTMDQSSLTIATGGVVTVDSGAYRGSTVVIGGGRQTDGLLSVQGQGSRLSVTGAADDPGDSATGQIIIGNLGVGLLEARDGALVEARNIELGRSLIDQGSIVAAGQGMLDIASGSRVVVSTTENTAYLGLQVGEGAGSTGTVTVDGAGSELNSTGGAGRIRLGYAGTGTLTVTDGAEARSFFLEAGRQFGGQGTVNVRDAGSLLTLSDAYGAFSANSGQAALLRLGRDAGSTGTLNVTNGGAVEIRNDPASDSDQPAIVAGTSFGSTGEITVSGAGSRIDLTLSGASNDSYAPGNSLYYGPRLRLGQLGGEGDVKVTQDGAITLSGENAELWVGEGTTVGQADLSNLAIYSRGQVTVMSTGNSPAAVVIGRGEGSNGRLSVFGNTSALNVTSDNQSGLGANVTVGYLGRGELAVQNGAQAIISGGDDAFPGLTIGRGSDDGTVAAVGTVLVSGANAAITVSGTNTSGTPETIFGEGGLITVGLREGATGILRIADGGLVRNSALNSATNIAAGAGSTGEVVLEAQGSRLEAGELLTIGADVDFSTLGNENLPLILPGSGGDGLLDIGAGAEVSADKIVLGETGVLSGAGSLGGDLIAHGRLMPGGDGAIGTLDHDGDFTLEAGAVLALDIDAFATGQADLIRTSGDIEADFGAITFQITLAQGLNSTLGSVTIIESAAPLAPLDMSIDALDGTRLRLTAVEGTGIVLEIRDLVLIGTSGTDTLRGAAGDDTLIGSVGADLLDGRGGSDIVDYSGSGAVEINLINGIANGGQATGDVLVNVENLIGSASADRLTGDSKINLLDGGAGDDFLSGGAANDCLLGGGGADRLIGGAGSDILDGGSSGDTLTGGSGADQLFGGLGADQLFGGLNIDSIFGGEAADQINGGAANDVLHGEDGNDRIDTGAGSDIAFGGAGNDTLIGRGGRDVLDGGAGDDRLFGGAGLDTLSGGAGADMLDGGAGLDAASYAEADARVIADLAGMEVQEGDALGDQFNGVETLVGSAFNDFLYGDDQGNLLIGGAASDNLFGRGGDDTLMGEEGVDLLRGNGGIDVLTGGGGNDRFFFLDLDDSGVGAGARDIITDFESGELISLSAIDADIGASGNNVFSFLGTDAFTGTAGEVRFAKSTANNLTLIHADVDGDAMSDFQIELTGVIDLVAGDFVL